MANSIITVTADNFEESVLAVSHVTPVLLDFWAPWCGPCRALTPILERLADEFAGRLILAKANADENTGLAQRYGVRGIPAVKAIVNGEVADEFVGLQAEPLIRAFIEQVIASKG